MAADEDTPPEGESSPAAGGGRRGTAKKGTAKKAAKKATPRRLPRPDDVERPWLASYPPAVPEAYRYPLVPLTRLLDDAAQDFPQSVAVEFLGYALTYREVLDRVDRLAAALAKAGVSKGDRVGVILPNCPQHVIAVFAILRLGAIVVEHSPLESEAELEHQINDAGCRVLVCLDPVYRTLANLKGRLTTVEHIFATGIDDALPFPRNTLFPLVGRRDGTYYKIPEGEGVHRFADVIRRTAPTAVQARIDPQVDVALVLYTGDDAGGTRGVMLTHANLVANAFQARLWMPDIQAGRENILSVMPFSHAYGFTTCLGVGILSAATLTLLPRFDRDQVLKTIQRRKPTLFPGVPTIYAALNGAPNVRKHDLSSIRACLSGAAPLSADVAKQFEHLTGGKVREGYGLTETSPLTHANPIYGRAKPGSIGLPVSDTVCTLVDLDDRTRPAPPGGPGELAIAGPQVMKGYWNRPEETAAVLRDGWLLTGDIAEVDAEGYFTLVGRRP